MPDETVWIWIEAAVTEYGRSRAWFDEQVRRGAIRYDKPAGERRTYLLRADVEREVGKSKERGQASHLRPRPDEQVG